MPPGMLQERGRLLEGRRQGLFTKHVQSRVQGRMSDDGMTGFTIELPAPRRRRPKQDRSHPVHPLAQAMELADRMKRLVWVNTFEPGQLCKEKAGLSIFNDSPILVYCRPLSMNDFQDREIVRDYIQKHIINRIDCIVGRLHDDSQCVMFLPHWTALLEPYEPPTEEAI